MNVSPIAVLAAAIAAWLFGAAWYMTLGRIWRDALTSQRGALSPTGKSVVPIVPMIVSFVAEVLMAYLFLGLLAHLGGPSVRAGLITGALLWTGFVLTTLVTNDAYQGARLHKTAIDAGHWLGVLLIQGAVLGAMG